MAINNNIRNGGVLLAIIGSAAFAFGMLFSEHHVALDMSNTELFAQEWAQVQAAEQASVYASRATSPVAQELALNGRAEAF